MASAVTASFEIAVRESEPVRIDPAPRIPDAFVVFDLETTGLDPDVNEIIEIGAIRVDQTANTRQTFRVLVRSRHAVPRYITGLTGITQDMLVDEGIGLHDALDRFLAFAANLPLVSYAAGFDMAFVDNAMRQRHPHWTMPNPVTCALKLSKLAWPYLPSFRLADVADNGAHYAEPPHRALGDCERTLLVYVAAVRELQKAD